MKLSLSCIAIVFLSSHINSSGEVHAQSGQVSLERYVVKKGDTCIKIAKRELGSRKAYREIHQHNPSLGKLPHRLKPGTLLLLPRVIRAPDAHITQKRGTVRIRKPSAQDWFTGKKGSSLFRSWRVNSRSKSSAELTFADDSAIYLRENTVVIVYGPSSSKVSKTQAYASLERGTLRTRLSGFDKSKPVVVSTPGSETTISSGSAVLSVDDSGTSRVANHSGEGIVVRSRKNRSKSVSVAVGMGSKVKQGKPPEKPRPLPPTPSWQQGKRHVVGSVATGGKLSGKWQPVKEAAQYRVEIAIDPVARAVVASVVVPSSVTEFEASGLAPGNYYASVSAIDNDKFESIPSPREEMKISSVSIEGGSLGSKGSALKVVLGSTLRASDGVLCAQGSGSPGAELSITETTSVRCFKNGVELPSQPIEIVPLTATFASQGPIPRNQDSALTITLAADGLEIPKLAASSDELEIQSVSQEGTMLIVTARPSESTESKATLNITTASGGLMLATTEVEIQARPEAPEPPPTVVKAPWTPSFEAGIHAGLGSGDREFAIAGGLEPQFDLGLWAGLRLSKRFAIEVEGDFAEANPRIDSKNHTSIAVASHARYDVLDGDAADLHILAGPTATFLDGTETTTTLGAVYGLGIRLRSTERSEIRMDGRHVISPAQGADGIANQLRVKLGFGLLF